MKKLLFAALITVSSFVSAQGIDFGVKGGVVFNSSQGLWEGLGTVKDGKGSTGFQVGAVLRARLAGLYIQPELLYTQTTNEYDNYKVKSKSMDIPVGIGKRFLGIAHVQVGPTFSYYFDDKLNVGEFANATQDQFGVSFHVGAGVQISKLLFDLRYQRGFSKLSSEFVKGTSNFQTENRPQHINLSVTYLF
ncbi:outer membrane beta-barrel protein [Faecalibacter rhinopitheci]|uniref:PorT family protein n=1 Tax=Faecalibacter rhinopitheci TaxID=2779678 RepID=A0A8J7FQD8_9FLAO|nr:outer membrane beta-barrel protein [Faecalibacter rhinopitheci]MBF0597579.1 PorT family protein [Faecalibacter rhinopitheci]MBQ0148631.1 PorT family protein [Candidatus Onthonaster equi]